MKEGRTGFTTGTCAAAASKAAVMLLCGMSAPSDVEIGLPDGSRVRLPIVHAENYSDKAKACVRKDAGDDPDVTDGCLVCAEVKWVEGCDIKFVAGEGVGVVTKPGLSVPPGEPAINPVPRQMIKQAINEVTTQGVEVVASIPGGRQLAEKTFNPRLGIYGGLSILGTSGIVRPFSTTALRDALKCALNVAAACKIKEPVFVPGRIGQKAAQKLFKLSPEQLIEVGNEWGFVLEEAAALDFEELLVVGHPGKLAKTCAGWWDTHSSRSDSPVPFVIDLARKLGINVHESRTVEGIFSQVSSSKSLKLAETLAEKVRTAVRDRLMDKFGVAVVLVNMKGDLLGYCGDLSRWK